MILNNITVKYLILIVHKNYIPQKFVCVRYDNRIRAYYLQKSHTGVPGGNGLFAVKHVEVVYLIERDSATNLNVRTQFITNAVEMIMKI